eukprot:6176628-Pleurochrysis_carterae.AAC.2
MSSGVSFAIKADVRLSLPAWHRAYESMIMYECIQFCIFNCQIYSVSKRLLLNEDGVVSWHNKLLRLLPQALAYATTSSATEYA